MDRSKGETSGPPGEWNEGGEGEGEEPVLMPEGAAVMAVDQGQESLIAESRIPG